MMDKKIIKPLKEISQLYFKATHSNRTLTMIIHFCNPKTKGFMNSTVVPLVCCCCHCDFRRHQTTRLQSWVLKPSLMAVNNISKLCLSNVRIKYMTLITNEESAGATRQGVHQQVSVSRSPGAPTMPPLTPNRNPPRGDIVFFPNLASKQTRSPFLCPRPTSNSFGKIAPLV